MDIRLFVFQHMPCRLPDCFADKSIYTPIQCGRAVNKEIEAFKFQQAVAWLTTEIEKGENSAVESGWINEGDVLAEFS